MPETDEIAYFKSAIAEMAGARLSTADRAKAVLIDAVDRLAKTRAGMAELYNNIVPLVESGIFKGTAWNQAEQLVPALVKGTLQAGRPNNTFEILSELRMLAISKGDLKHVNVKPAEAQKFVASVLILNLEFALREPSEEARLVMAEEDLNKAHNLLEFLLRNVDPVAIKEMLALEIDHICEQRPVMTKKIRELIGMLNQNVEEYGSSVTDRKLVQYINAVRHPTEATRQNYSIQGYGNYLAVVDQAVLKAEADTMAASMRETGLVSQFHAVLLGFLIKNQPGLVANALGLSELGKAELSNYRKRVFELIEENVVPHNCQCIYGLSEMLNNAVFANRSVRMALDNIRRINIHPTVERRILDSSGDPSPHVTARQYLLGAIFRVLGQPLGIGQGNNPTCQSARGISMWSQHSPARLIDMITAAATDNRLHFRFEHKELDSVKLAQGLAEKIDFNLDAVSVVLVPHLDRIYNAMMKAATGRGEDPHKWVNPAMYGEWIPVNFLSAYSFHQNAIVKYRHFLRTFFANFHPDFNRQKKLVYPNPVGIFLTSATGQKVGFHAVSLLRVGKDPEGTLRAYFYNPNNEGRQDWGQGIKPAVRGNGERHGESSVPFHGFAARIYAFHYSQLDTLSLVPDGVLLPVEKLAIESWGKAYSWLH